MGFIREEELKLDAKFLGLDIKDLKPIYTNDMIDEINNYDRGKIIDQAKSLQDLTPSHSGARAASAFTRVVDALWRVPGIQYPPRLYRFRVRPSRPPRNDQIAKSCE